MHETRELARFAANTRFEDLPPALADRVKCYILDTVGVGLLGILYFYSRVLGNDAAHRHANGASGAAAYWPVCI